MLKSAQKRGIVDNKEVVMKINNNKMRSAVLIITVLIGLLFSSCAFLEELILSDNSSASSSTQSRQSTPSKSYYAGDILNGKTIVWVNTGAGRWRYLAMGTPSEPMPWDLDSSRYISTKYLSSDMGAGKENSIFLKSEFESNSSKAHTVKNSAVMYCISRGGWLPSRDEAEKIAQFTSKDFWTSQCEASAKAYYYSPLQRGLQSKWRNDRDSIVAIPVYYLDAQGNITEP